MADQSNPQPSAELASAFATTPQPTPVQTPPQPLPDAADVPPAGWTPDEWALQTVHLDAPQAEQTLGLGQPPAEPKPAAPPPGYVPQQALAEARAEAKAQAEKIERMNQRFEDTIRLLQARAGGEQHPPAAAPAPALPDPEQEPVKHMTARFERMEQALNSLIGMQQQGAQQSQIVNRIQGDELNFRTQHADYDNALNHVRNKMTAIFGAQNVPNFELALAHSALQQGKSPAEQVYNMARELGFRAGNGAGATADQGQAAAAAAQKLVQAQTGVANAKTLGNVAGQSASAGMTLEALADLSDPAEFSKAFDKLMGNQRAAASQLPMFTRR